MNNSFYIYEDCDKIGNTIKKLRKQAGLSQSKLAEGICNRTTIIHLEAGYSKLPSIFLLNQLCRRLSITLDDFFLIAYGGDINQLWLIRNEIEALLKTREYEKAYLLTKKNFNSSIHPMDTQYFGLIEGHYFYNLKDYALAKNKYFNALSVTSKDIEDEVYTLNEIRLINGIIYCNWQIDGKLSTPETLNYIKMLNNSLYNYPIDKEYRIIIALMLSTLHFYFTLKQYKDCITIGNNIMELSYKYCCYDYLGNLWMLLGNIYEIVNDIEKSKEYYNKSNTFFKLFNEEVVLSQSIDHQAYIYENNVC